MRLPPAKTHKVVVASHPTTSTPSQQSQRERHPDPRSKGIHSPTAITGLAEALDPWLQITKKLPAPYLARPARLQPYKSTARNKPDFER